VSIIDLTPIGPNTHPRIAGARFHSETASNPLIYLDRENQSISELLLKLLVNPADLQSAPFAARDTPPFRV
jgi:hypothetical protein